MKDKAVYGQKRWPSSKSHINQCVLWKMLIVALCGVIWAVVIPWVSQFPVPKIPLGYSAGATWSFGMSLETLNGPEFDQSPVSSRWPLYYGSCVEDTAPWRWTRLHLDPVTWYILEIVSDRANSPSIRRPASGLETLFPMKGKINIFSSLLRVLQLSSSLIGSHQVFLNLPEQLNRKCTAWHKKKFRSSWTRS